MTYCAVKQKSARVKSVQILNFMVHAGQIMYSQIKTDKYLKRYALLGPEDGDQVSFMLVVYITQGPYSEETEARGPASMVVTVSQQPRLSINGIC